MLDVQNTILNEFRDYRQESNECHVQYDRRISSVEYQVNHLYQHYYQCALHESCLEWISLEFGGGIKCQLDLFFGQRFYLDTSTDRTRERKTT